MSGLVIGRRRPFDLIWFYITLAVIGFVYLVATGHGAEPEEEKAESQKPKARIVFVGASWCGPCKAQEKSIVPELIKRGHEVLIYDLDTPHVRRLFPAPSIPAWYVIGDPIHASSADDVLDQLCLKPQPVAETFAAAPTPNARQPPAPDLVAQLRRFLGTKKPQSHSSLAWSFEEPLEIDLDAKTKITRPKQLFAEFDFRDDVLVVTFADPMPQAHVVKAGATLSVDVPRVRIKANVITATADIAFGLQKDFEFTITKSPFDE